MPCQVDISSRVPFENQLWRMLNSWEQQGPIGIIYEIRVCLVLFVQDRLLSKYVGGGGLNTSFKSS